jgi:hypothetical protein
MVEPWSDHVPGLESSKRLRGAYYFRTEPGPSDVCGSSPTSPQIRSEATSIVEGKVVHLPDTRIFATQDHWLPIPISLTKPISITASGQMQPRSQSPMISGPEGISERPKPFPEYDTQGQLASQLLAPKFPYQSLIGRICRGAHSCGEVFLIGKASTLCISDPKAHLELWTNLSGVELSGTRTDWSSKDRLGFYDIEISGATGCKS